MRAITPGEVDDLANRLKQLNDTVIAVTGGWESFTEQQLIKAKAKLEKKVNDELQDVADKIKVKIEPTVNAATAKLQKYTKLLNVPTSPDAVPSYLLDMATELFGGPQAKLIQLLASYAPPMARLAAELQRSSTITIPSVSTDNVLNTVVPKII